MPDRLLEYDEFEELVSSILNTGQNLRFTAHGSSMRPFIINGDTVEVHPVIQEQIKRGDVILCRLLDGRLVVHRVAQIYHDSLLIQGDALPYSDGFIPYANVLGRVELIIRKDKSIRPDAPWIRALSGIWLLMMSLIRIMYRVFERIRRIL